MDVTVKRATPFPAHVVVANGPRMHMNISFSFSLLFLRVFTNGTLLISNTIADNEGGYLCKADNKVGEAISKLVQVNINGKNWTLQLF